MPPVLFLAHGASGTAASMQPHVKGLRERGIDARAIDLPKRKAESAVPVYREAVSAVTAAAIGGHSYGGRVASLLAAAEPGPAALVLLSYPLHRPGSRDWESRADHWRSLTCPVLLLSGEADPFAQIDLLREAARRLPDAELVTYPRVGHGLAPVLDDALDRIARFLTALPGGALAAGPAAG